MERRPDGERDREKERKNVMERWKEKERNRDRERGCLWKPWHTLLTSGANISTDSGGNRINSRSCRIKDDPGVRGSLSGDALRIITHPQGELKESIPVPPVYLGLSLSHTPIPLHRCLDFCGGQTLNRDKILQVSMKTWTDSYPAVFVNLPHLSMSWRRMGIYLRVT